MKYRQLGLIGCGLMGGSFALALRHAGLVDQVVGFSPSASTVNKALQLGVIDRSASSPAQAAQGSDLVLVAVPVAATQAVLQEIATTLEADSLIMDVGSTKCDVVHAAQSALKDKFACFVPAHPIAGKEHAGVEHADAQLYQQRQVILTPTGETPLARIKLATQIWQALGSQVSHMSPEAHDAAFAAVSHLPHVLAFAFMNSISQQAQGQTFLELAGPGFRDFTRIAAGDPKIWRDILLANRDEVLRQSQLFQEQLRQFDQLISAGDAAGLQSAITQASGERAGWHMNKA
jgi:prephenate dehydrogenase